MLKVTPDQQFARLVKYSMVLFLVILGYFMFSDLKIPLTTEAMATRNVVKVAPQISGRVNAVFVSNNQTVKKGDVLFSLDQTSYQLALETSQLALEKAIQNNEELDASIKALNAQIDANKAILNQAQRDAKRLDALYKIKGVSLQLRTQADTDVTTAKAQLMASEAQLIKLNVSRGRLDQNNLKLRQAQNQIAQAKLNLSYTQIHAEENGVVTNLQLMPGSMVSTNKPVLALVSDGVDIIADFREKTLQHVSSQTKAWVTFDSDPGKIFKATVTSRDAGVSDGQFNANGILATPIKSNRWIRDAQRMRLHLKLTNKNLPLLATGSLATVQIRPNSVLYGFLAKLQIKAISLMHYIY